MPSVSSSSATKYPIGPSPEARAPTLTGPVHASGTSSAPLRWSTHLTGTNARTNARTHAHTPAAPRGTLSFTIASQTFASSPDGSVSSSAANSACSTPAAAVGDGCRFRASSTVTSSSSPCNQHIRSFGHSHTRSSRQESEGWRALPSATHSSLRVVPWRYTRRVSEHPWSTA